MSISVIVPTRNEARNISHLLESLPPELELIVCDASTDATPEIVSRLRARNTHILRMPAGSVAQARQVGALASTGDVLVFTDADVEFDAHYFDRLRANAVWDGLCGAKLSPDLFRRDYALMLAAQRIAYQRLGIAGASGSNMAVTRRAFMAMGGFREQLRCNEDTELFMRGGRLGFRMRFDEELIVWARDHRRLRSGRMAKIVHSLVRNCLLYLTCPRRDLPRLLEDDWGYWKHSEADASNDA